jgi:hypothetical protein
VTDIKLSRKVLRAPSPGRPFDGLRTALSRGDFAGGVPEDEAESVFKGFSGDLHQERR